MKINGKKYVPPEVDVSYIDECLRAGEPYTEPYIPNELPADHVSDVEINLADGRSITIEPASITFTPP